MSAAGLDLGVLREVLADSAAGSDFIRRDLDALFAGDFMRTFALDRCCEELQNVTELARDHHLPFQVSESVAELYRQALRRYGPRTGNCWVSRCSKSKPACCYATRRPRTDQMIQGRPRPVPHRPDSSGREICACPPEQLVIERDPQADRRTLG